LPNKKETAQMGRSRIPVSAPDLTGNEEAYVLDAVRSSWISSTGRYVDMFEQAFAEACGTRSAIAVANGTIALHLALMALGVRPGDEVIVPALTYVATANAVRYVGGEPVFVDVDPATWCLDPAKLEDAITRRTRGIIAVHLYGHPADMDAINRVGGIHGLWVVEDAAEAHFATYKGKPVGGLADIATFSFYGNKLITSGEGGAVTVSDPRIDLRARTLRGQGMDPQRRYYFPVTGYNFRLTNVACAILCAQIERREAIFERRRSIFDTYRSGLSGIQGIDFQPVAEWADPAPWLFNITIDPEAYGHTRDNLATRLDAEGIETRPFFIPLTTLPPFREGAIARGDAVPVSMMLGGSGLNLPTFGGLATDDQMRIIDVVRAFAR
jgi:perosamine synthetase